MGKPKISNLPHYLWEDYINWDGSWEIIDGIPYAMSPAPSLKHQSISQKIATLFQIALTNCDLCQALLPVDWKIDEDTVVQPDNLIVCGEAKGNYLTKAPCSIVEILSPSTEKKDNRGVAIFAKACFGHPSPSKRQKLNATTIAFGTPDVLRTCHSATPS